MMSEASSGGVRLSTIRTDSHRFDNLAQRFHQRLANFLFGDLDCLRHSGDQVSSLDLHGLDFVAGVRRSDRDLDQFSGALADQQAVLALDVMDDRLIHFVAPERTERVKTTPASESTAPSVVPPPISTIMLPVGSVTGRLAPIAAAIGSSIK
jgi:hypothetical protein